MAVNKYKKHRKNRRALKTSAKAEAEQAELRGGTAKENVDEGPAIYPLIKKAINPRLSREKKLAAVDEAFSTPPDKQSEDEESKRRQQLNREQYKSRQALKNPPQGLGKIAGGRSTSASSRDNQEANRQASGPEEQERQEQERGQKLQQGTKQLRGEAQRRMKAELKKKLKAEAKAKLKKAIKKKIIQRVIVFLLALSWEVWAVIAIIIIVIMSIIIYGCDIPGLSIALDVIDFFTGENFSAICDAFGG